jgi:hypothetical protein
MDGMSRALCNEAPNWKFNSLAELLKDYISAYYKVGI